MPAQFGCPRKPAITAADPQSRWLGWRGSQSGLKLWSEALTVQSRHQIVLKDDRAGPSRRAKAQSGRGKSTVGPGKADTDQTEFENPGI